MPWKDKSHNGYGVLTYTLKSFSHSVVNNFTPEFSVPPGKDFTVICNYGATDLSASAHVEMFYSDVPGGTFRARTKTGGYYFNATSALIKGATKVIPVDISAQGEYPVYKLKVTGNAAGNKGGGLVKFVVYWGEAPVTNVT